MQRRVNSAWLTDWVTACPTDRLTDWLNGWVTVGHLASLFAQPKNLSTCWVQQQQQLPPPPGDVTATTRTNFAAKNSQPGKKENRRKTEILSAKMSACLLFAVPSPFFYSFSLLLFLVFFTFSKRLFCTGAFRRELNPHSEWIIGFSSAAGEKQTKSSNNLPTC